MYKNGILCTVFNADFSLLDYIEIYLIVSKICMCKEFIKYVSSFYYS
jgi:hypothetical protein